MARLGDICTVNMGQSPDSATYNEVGRGLPFFQGNADFGRLHPAVRVWCSEPTKIAHTGDILISVRAPIGAMNVADQDCCIGRGLAAIQVNENICDPKYLWYAIQSKVSDLNAKGTGSTFKAISKSTLTDTEVLLVPLDAQKNIARILSNVENSILFRKEQLTKLDELIKARFVEMFGDPISNTKRWDVIELGSLTGIGSSKRIFEKEYVSEGIPFYRTKEIVELSKGNPISTELYITEKRFLEIKEQYGVPQKGDLLISAVGTIGVIWIVDEKNDFYFKDGNLIRVDSSDRFNSTYMKTLLESLIAEYKKQMSSGTAYSALTISGLMKMKIYDVPLSLQNQFAAFVAEVDKSKVEVQKALDQTQLLFDSLMQQYFG